MQSSPNQQAATLGFSPETGNPALDPTPEHCGYRTAFYRLANIDEYPEAIPLAQQVILEHIRSVEAGSKTLPDELTSSRSGPEHLPLVLETLRALAKSNSRPWDSGKKEVAAACALHYAKQFAPTALVDGCWLQRTPAVPLSHTEIGSRLTGLFEHAVRAYADPLSHHSFAYRRLFEHLGTPLDVVTSRRFAEHPALSAPSLEFPVLLLSMGQFPRTFLPQLVGLTLALHYMDVPSFGATLIQDACALHGVPMEEDTSDDADYAERGKQLASAAVELLLGELSGAVLGETWDRVRCGVAMGVMAFTRWIEETQRSAPTDAPDPHTEMIRLLRSKAPHAHGYHRGSGSSCLDE